MSTEYFFHDKISFIGSKIIIYYFLRFIKKDNIIQMSLKCKKCRDACQAD